MKQYTEINLFFFSKKGCVSYTVFVYVDMYVSFCKSIFQIRNEKLSLYYMFISFKYATHWQFKMPLTIQKFTVGNKLNIRKLLPVRLRGVAI